MDMARSNGYSAAALPASLSRGLVRWAVLGAAGVIALIIALSHSMTASAAAPCIPINYTTCVNTGTSYINSNVGNVYGVGNVGYGYTNNGSGYPPNTVISTSFDPRYGFVSVVTDNNGVLIDVNAATGQRIFPFPDYGVGAFYGNGFIGANFNNGFVGNGIYGNGVFNNGFVGNGIYGNGVFNNGFVGNGLYNQIPAGATYVAPGVYSYKDKSFCPGDGSALFYVNRGYTCQNGGTVYGFFEVTQPTTAPAAAPVTAAPVAAPTTQVVAPAVVQQAPVVAAPAQMPAALTAPQVQAPDTTTSNTGVHAFSAPAVTAPAATTDLDDHRG